jgi:hypothetical protein
VEVQVSDRLPRSELFADVLAASQFFERGSVGYSATSDPTRFDGLELRTSAWSVTPVKVLHARSSFLEDESLVPTGTAALDCALDALRAGPLVRAAEPARRTDQPAFIDLLAGGHPGTRIVRVARCTTDPDYQAVGFSGWYSQTSKNCSRSIPLRCSARSMNWAVVTLP